MNRAGPPGSRPVAPGLAARVALGLIRAYQLVLSPALHTIAGPAAGCRFTPTCSVYAAEAVRRHGFRRGTALALHRVSRCHPWNEGGHDPVPPAPPSPPPGPTAT